MGLFLTEAVLHRAAQFNRCVNMWHSIHSFYWAILYTVIQTSCPKSLVHPSVAKSLPLGADIHVFFLFAAVDTALQADVRRSAERACPAET